MTKKFAFSVLFGLFLASSAAGFAAPVPCRDALGTKGLEALQKFSGRPEHRAFVASRDGTWGQAWGYATPESAMKRALEECRRYSKRCAVCLVNGRVMQTWYEKTRPPMNPVYRYLTRPQSIDQSLARIMLLTGLSLYLFLVVVAYWHPIYIPTLNPFMRYRGMRSVNVLGYSANLVYVGLAWPMMGSSMMWAVQGPWWSWGWPALMILPLVPGSLVLVLTRRLYR